MTSHSVPLSLGKPSLRRRLEAYYSVVAPEQLEDKNKGTTGTSATCWLDRFDLIYAKYGGTAEGERRLAAKLSKKYGATVRLQTVVAPAAEAGSAVSAARDSRVPVEAPVPPGDHWQPNSSSTGVLDFASDLFDPRAALGSTLEQVQAANPIVAEASMMDRVDRCSWLLPRTDPLYRPPRATVRKRDERLASKATGARSKEKPPPFFSSVAAPFQEGPMSVLHEAMTQRLRVRVVVRYVDGIRGTATGFVMAFDKHFNLLLRDAEEVYSPRLPADGRSNTEMELRRRRLGMGIPEANGQPPAWSSRHRYLKQVLIRGDNVVLVYRAEDERSSWPPTAKSSVSMHRKQRERPARTNERVGSPGSLVYATADRDLLKQKKSSYKSAR
jgi:small nuclear ribonucleoprotein (snRNP)-like protein